MPYGPMSNQTEKSAGPVIFDRALVRRRRNRWASRGQDSDFLFREVGERLVERLGAVNRSFERVLLLGPRGLNESLYEALEHKADLVVAADLSEAITYASDADARVVMDEELLPFASESFDLVLSNLSLHWVNDLPGALVQIRRALKPDGLFLGAMLGRGTLIELSAAIMEAEDQVTGVVGPRISPFADVRDMGQLLQRAGLALPVSDADTLNVSYGNSLSLMRDLRQMGEANALVERHSAPLSAATLAAIDRCYRRTSEDADGRLSATFQVLYLTGWAPHPDQPKPLRPGSAETRLADALGVKETGLKS